MSNFSPVAAGIVTFNPDIARLKECLEALSAQVEALYLFDNASKNFSEIEAVTEVFPALEILPRVDENRGMAFALNALASQAIARGYDTMVFMDQDSKAAPNLVKAELMCMRTKVGIASPQIVDRNEQTQPELNNEAFEIPRAITSGAMVNLTAFEEVGGCDERLFVDWVDFELCDNLKNHGYKIVCTNRTYLLHEIGKKELAFSGKIINRKGKLEDVKYYRTNHSSKRRFDKARSQAITIEKYGKDSGIGRDEYRVFKKEFLKGVLFERRKADFVVSMAKGYQQGVAIARSPHAEHAEPGAPWDYSPWFSHDVMCFEREDDTTSWRFSFKEMTDSSGLSIVDDSGATVALCDDLGFIGNRFWVYAIIPNSIDAFEIRRGDETIFALTPRMCSELRFHRDCMLANPGNDAFFRRFSDHEERTWKTQREQSLATASEGTAPKFSIVMPLFKSDPKFLRAAIGSVLKQVYANWELVLVNANPDLVSTRAILDAISDERIREIKLEQNLGIAGNTNCGIANASGDYVAFLDHDDLLHPDALLEYACAVAKDPDIDILYCDEDNFHNTIGDRFMPIYKPRLNLDLLLSHNYIVHFLTVSARMLKQTTRSDDDTSGAQDYDLLLKCLEAGGRCANVPRILYHWRAHAGSTNGGQVGGKTYADDACVTVLSRYFARNGLHPEIKRTQVPYHYRVEHHAAKDARISLVMWGKSAGNLAARAQKLLRLFANDASGAMPSEVVLVPFGKSCEMASEQASYVTSDNDISCILSTCASTLNDAFAIGCQTASGEVLLFVGPDVESASSNCPDLLTGYLALDGAGVVAPKAFTRDGLVYTSGIAFDDEGVPTTLNEGLSANMGGGYLGMAECSCAYSLVGPSCFAIRKDVLENALDARITLASPFAAMTDLCYTLRADGKRCVVIPDASITCKNDSEVDMANADDRLLLKEKWSDEQWWRDVNANGHVSYSTGRPKLKAAEFADHI